MTKTKRLYEQYDCKHHPSIHISGSVRGMKKCGYWKKDDVIVRVGSYYYNLSIYVD